MNSTADAEDRPRERQVSTPSDNPSSAWNALKHGLRSAAVLLPDDDGQEFQHLRRDLFETYRPRTGDEAACVEAMAAHHWRVARCRRWQAVYDAQTDALLTGDPNRLAGHICETDSHVWIHKSMDCVLQESRLDRMLCRARDKLLLLQKLRRNNLIAGAMEPEPIFWPEEPLRSGRMGHPPAGTGAQFGTPHDERPTPEWKSGNCESVGADRDPPPREPSLVARAPQVRGLGGSARGPGPSTNLSQDGAIGNSDERAASLDCRPRAGLPVDARVPLAGGADRNIRQPGGVAEPTPPPGAHWRGPWNRAETGDAGRSGRIAIRPRP
jgi:hypothetical protein